MENLTGNRVYIESIDDGKFLIIDEVMVTRCHPEFQVLAGTLLNRFCYHPEHKENGRFIPFSNAQATEFSVLIDGTSSRLISKPIEFNGVKRSNYNP